jgi:hypothetical protein
VDARVIAILILVPLFACTSGANDESERDRAKRGDGRQASSEENGSGGKSGAGSSNDKGGPEESSTLVEEPADDATFSGDVKGYPELTSAAIEGSDEGVLFDLRFARPVPDKTPPAVQSILALTIIDADGGRYLLNALGTDQGWSATVITVDGKANFGGRFDMSGKKVVIGIPWSDLGGPKVFNWIVSSSWTGDPKKGTSYAFDSIPDQGFRGFPEKD